VEKSASEIGSNTVALGTPNCTLFHRRHWALASAWHLFIQGVARGTVHLHVYLKPV